MHPANPSSSPAAQRRLLLVDDHPILRGGLAQLLGGEPDLTIAGHAENAAQALAALREQPYDLVILDISLRGVSGIDLLKDIRIHWPKLLVMVFSMHDEMLYAERALYCGARGYLMKSETPACILAAVRRVLAGQLYVSEAVNSRILVRLVDGGARASLVATSAAVAARCSTGSATGSWRFSNSSVGGMARARSRRRCMSA